MKIKLTAKGMATSPLTLQGLGLSETDDMINKLKKGGIAFVDPPVAELLEKHKMAVTAEKKDEVDDDTRDA